MKKLTTAAFIAATLAATNVNAQNLSITVTNLTHGMAFTPVLVAAHDNNGDLYNVGEAASANLQAMAEGGSLAGLNMDLDSIAATRTDSAGPLFAGKSITLSLNTDATPNNTLLSVVSMLLPTNDAFMGLDAIAIPSAAGTYTYYLNAYDAGTEPNNELIAAANGGMPGTVGMPDAPFVTTNGTGATGGVAGVDNNQTVHIHRGGLGDADPVGGNSDLVNTVHRWLNPVARVTVVVQ